MPDSGCNGANESRLLRAPHLLFVRRAKDPTKITPSIKYICRSSKGGTAELFDRLFLRETAESDPNPPRIKAPFVWVNSIVRRVGDNK